MGELCARFDVNQPDAPGGRGVIYVKSRWFATKFSLWVTDGLNAWVGEVLEEEVSRKAFSWDCTVADYLEGAAKYLGVQDSTSKYSFIAQENESRKLSYTLERDGVQLVANWKVAKSLNPRDITCDVLDFLMRGSSRLSEELQRKRRSLEQQKAEADRCLAESEKFRDEKLRFEEESYKKFVAVLNSKKEKIRALTEQLARSLPTAATNEVESEAESQDEFEETDKEDEDGENDDASKGDTLMETTEKGAGQNSGTTEILTADSPTADISSVDPGPSHLPTQDSHETNEKFNVPVAEISSFQPPAEAATDAVKFLGGPTYTSAPRKRRRQ